MGLFKISCWHHILLFHYLFVPFFSVTLLALLSIPGWMVSLSLFAGEFVNHITIIVIIFLCTLLFWTLSQSSLKLCPLACFHTLYSETCGLFSVPQNLALSWPSLSLLPVLTFFYLELIFTCNLKFQNVHSFSVFIFVNMFS